MPDFTEWFSAKDNLASDLTPAEIDALYPAELVADDPEESDQRIAGRYPVSEQDKIAEIDRLRAVEAVAVALIERVDVYGVAYDHDQVVQNLRAATHPPAK